MAATAEGGGVGGKPAPREPEMGQLGAAAEPGKKAGWTLQNQVMAAC